MRKTPRTQAVWERIAADLSLEPDVEFSTLARDLEDELYNALEKINRMEREVYTLRLYGNKDCTAQADEVLKEEAK